MLDSAQLKGCFCHLKQHSTRSGALLSDLLWNLLSEACKCSTFGREEGN